MKFKTEKEIPDANKLCEIVDSFAKEMKERLLYKLYVEGFKGWDSKSNMKSIVEKLYAKSEPKLINLRKENDFLDIANFAMFLWNNME